MQISAGCYSINDAFFKNPNAENFFGVPPVKRFKGRLKLMVYCTSA